MQSKDNTFTPNDIIDTIDNHFESECNLLFVCDKKLAEFIYEYILNNYVTDDDGETELDELNRNYKEYYVSLYFNRNDDKANLFIENAKYKNGYKINDLKDECINYYIAVDLDDEIVFDKLLGNDCTYNWIEIDWDECEDNCEDDELCEEIKLIEEYAKSIENGYCCSVCLMDILYELYVKGKNVGWGNHRDMIREVNEDE